MPFAYFNVSVPPLTVYVMCEEVRSRWEWGEYVALPQTPAFPSIPMEHEPHREHRHVTEVTTPGMLDGVTSGVIVPGGPSLNLVPVDQSFLWPGLASDTAWHFATPTPRALSPTFDNLRYARRAADQHTRDVLKRQTGRW